MRPSIHHVRRYALGAAVTSVLGFGATHAFATPAPEPSAPVCIFAECAVRCIQQGHDGGTCLTTQSCVCYDYES